MNNKHRERAKPAGVVTVLGMTHTTPPLPEDEFLAAIGWSLAEEATPAMHRDLFDAFILITSSDFAAPYLSVQSTEVEHTNEDPV